MLGPIPARRLGYGVHLLNALLVVGAIAAGARGATPPPPAPVAVVAPRAAAPEAAPLAHPPSAVIVERGLFGRPHAETRAPGPVEAPATPLPPAPLLVGTAAGGPGGGSAVFQGADGEQRLVAAGEAIDGEWRLVAVRRGEVMVEHRSGRQDRVPLPLAAFQ